MEGREEDDFISCPARLPKPFAWWGCGREEKRGEKEERKKDRDDLKGKLFCPSDFLYPIPSLLLFFRFFPSLFFGFVPSSSSFFLQPGFWVRRVEGKRGEKEKKEAEDLFVWRVVPSSSSSSCFSCGICSFGPLFPPSLSHRCPSSPVLSPFTPFLPAA